MNYNLKSFAVILGAFLTVWLGSCEKVEIKQQLYPVIQTDGVTNLALREIKFNGTVLRMGTDPVLDCGFIWMVKPITNIFVPTDTFRVSIGSNLNTNFSASGGTGFSKYAKYTVRAYVVTPNNVCYGNAVTFIGQ